MIPETVQTIAPPQDGVKARAAEKNTILLVDDESANLLALNKFLSPDYKILMAKSGVQALKLIKKSRPDLILLDIMMPGMDGFEVLERLKANRATRDIPVIFITGLMSESNEEMGFLLGAVDYVRKPFNAAIVRMRVDLQLRAKANTDYLRRRAEQLADDASRHALEVLAGQGVAIQAMASLVEERDSETGQHLYHTQHYIRLLADTLRTHPRFRDRLDENFIDMLYQSAPLHDIGKVGTPDAILLKPGPLKPEERVVMQRHPEIGYRAIVNVEKKAGRRLDFLVCAKEIIRFHHEKWDGSGYPTGLAGDAIPLSARLMALADVYDALISRRVYRQPMSLAEAHKIILEGSGHHFDPDIVAAFVARESEFAEIAQSLMD